MKVIIIGCGRMGQELARAMSLSGHGVVVVDRSPEALESLGESFRGSKIIGIGFDREVLAQAEIEKAEALAAVTDCDEANIVIARLAREVFGVPKVVARLYEPRKAEVYRRLGLQVVAPSTWSVGRMTELLTYSRLDTVLSLGNGEVQIIRADISALLDDRTVNDLTIPGQAHVVAIRREGRTFLPTLRTRLKKGDIVHVAAQSTALERLKALLALT